MSGRTARSGSKKQEAEQKCRAADVLGGEEQMVPVKEAILFDLAMPRLHAGADPVIHAARRFVDHLPSARPRAIRQIEVLVVAGPV